MNRIAQTTAGVYEVRLEGETGEFEATLRSNEIEPGIWQIMLRLENNAPAVPPRQRIAIPVPLVDVHARWHPDMLHNRLLPPPWQPPFVSEATRNAPVVCAHSLTGHNRMTAACSETLKRVTVDAHVHEETACLLCRFNLFEYWHEPMTNYETVVRVDTRDIPYFQTLDHVRKWWESMPEHAPRKVPDVARQPMYSTWYSFHQELDVEDVLTQCRIGKKLGCNAIIIDDGWQTLDNKRGYAFTGDWQPERIPDMKGFVRRVHDEGMKLLLWYAVPLVGSKSQAYHRFKDKLLRFSEEWNAGIFDPRYPEVREYLIGLYETACREWDLDGFKLDFVDEFGLTAIAPPPVTDAMDFESVPKAADRLLTDVMDRLQAIKPDIMVEFRQAYIGPRMRRYGNMFRAGDSPGDSVTNRMRTLDLRLLSGDTAVHSDMFMWHENDPVESAALEILSILFSVPQISVRLDRLPDDHLAMSRFWLQFWREHRDVLLDGELRPTHPESFFPVVVAKNEHKCVAAVYDNAVVQLTEAVPAQLWVVNGTRADRIVLECGDDCGSRSVVVQDCQGNTVREESRRLAPGLHVIPVPPAGLVHCRQA
jgi:alpha-galactosidase